jgi:hypothetical protein
VTTVLQESQFDENLFNFSFEGWAKSTHSVSSELFFLGGHPSLLITFLRNSLDPVLSHSCSSFEACRQEREESGKENNGRQ